MINEAHPYSQTRAARTLAEALKRYTAREPGGLRALAASLELKQATVLSHMATGRMAIPLDRATALATKLELDVPDFCLAVLQQRAPAVYNALNDALGVSALGELSPLARQLVRMMMTARCVTEDHLSVIEQVVVSDDPSERWLAPLEIPIINAVRKSFPDGIPIDELRVLLNGLEAFLEH